MINNRYVKTAPDTCEAVFFEKGLWPVAGVDEAGRGPLAGPVVACALVLPPGYIIEGVWDSKAVSVNRRKHLAQEIITAAVIYSYGIVDEVTIDNINIHNAALLAMRKAINGLSSKPKVVLVDGKFSPPIDIPSLCLIKGETHSHSIAAASILAKQARDEIMMNLHDEYPLYGFNKHKGYGTKAHKEAILKYGLCPAHRLSYKLT